MAYAELSQEGGETGKEKEETRQCVNYARQGMHSGARVDKKQIKLKFSRE